MAQRLGYLKIPAGLVDPRIGDQVAPAVATSLCLVTGSQGEPMSALSRIAIDDHRHVGAGARRRRGVLGARDPGQRALDRPRGEPHRAARRRHHQRGHQARPRVRPRQRGGAEAAAVARAAALLHPDPRVVPAALPARARRRAPHAEPAEPRRGDGGRERRRAALRPRRRLDCRQGARRPGADRRHVGHGPRRRGAARPAPPRRGRPHRARAGDQQADRHRRRRAGHHHARPRRRAGRREPHARRGAPHRRPARVGQPRGADRLRHDAGQDQRRTASLLPEARRASGPSCCR